VNTTTMRNGELQWKASILRQHEVYAYQAAYYLLEDEYLAAKAAKETLAALMYDEAFFVKAALLQQKQLKQMVMKQSLSAKALALQLTI